MQSYKFKYKMFILNSGSSTPIDCEIIGNSQGMHEC